MFKLTAEGQRRNTSFGCLHGINFFLIKVCHMQIKDIKLSNLMFQICCEIKCPNQGERFHHSAQDIVKVKYYSALLKYIEV